MNRHFEANLKFIWQAGIDWGMGWGVWREWRGEVMGIVAGMGRGMACKGEEGEGNCERNLLLKNFLESLFS